MIILALESLPMKLELKAQVCIITFEQKIDLGAELAHQYTNNILASLNDEKAKSQGSSAISLYINAFKTALEKDNQMCLCGLLGSQLDALPQQVKVEIQRFFELNIDWLQQVYIKEKGVTAESAKTKAIHLLASLEGMMIIAKVLDNKTAFDSIKDNI